MTISDIPLPEQAPAVLAAREKLTGAESRLAAARAAVESLRASIADLEEAAALADGTPPAALADALAAVGPAESVCRISERAVVLAAEAVGEALAAAGDDYKTAVRREVQAAGRVWIKAARTLAQAGGAMLEIRTAAESSAAAAAVIRDLPHVPGPFQAPDVLMQMAGALEAWVQE